MICASRHRSQYKRRVYADIPYVKWPHDLVLYCGRIKSSTRFH
jgi:hypothetical protein